MRRVVAVVVILAIALLVAPLAAQAQPAGKVPRIGYLSLVSPERDKNWVAAFGDGLRERGYVEGQTIVVERRHAAGRPARLPDLAAELVAKKVAGTIPIVFVAAPDPVGDGLVASLARPGGNITGLSDSHAESGPQAARTPQGGRPPPASRVVALLNPASPIAPPQLKTAQAR